jgi:hypothetical protein
MKPEDKILNIIEQIEALEKSMPKCSASSHLNWAVVKLRTAHNLLTMPCNPKREVRAKNRWTK